MDRADRRTGDRRPPLFQALTDLGRAPPRILAFEADDRFLHDDRELIGVTIRSTTPIAQALHPGLPIPLKDLVARLPRDPELLAQAHHRLALQPTGHKP